MKEKMDFQFLVNFESIFRERIKNWGDDNI